MEGEECLLDTLFDEENVENAQDVEMLDVEEGEIVQPISNAEAQESLGVDGSQVNRESSTGNSKSKKKKKKKKNKRKKGTTNNPKITDINRFVVDACKRLRERKHYLMWTAVGCLGVSALSDLVKEVDAIEACGGQKTTDGSRFRSGGGILWNIIKARDPNAYKEIMTKGKEFEKQFKHPLHDKQGFKQLQTGASSQSVDPVTCKLSDDLKVTSNGQIERSTGEQKRGSVHDRIRVPVSYEDLVVEKDPKDELA